MADKKLSKDGLNKVWLKVMELIKSLTGNVDKSKGTLQEQVDKLNSNLSTLNNKLNVHMGTGSGKSTVYIKHKGADGVYRPMFILIVSQAGSPNVMILCSYDGTVSGSNGNNCMANYLIGSETLISGIVISSTVVGFTNNSDFSCQANVIPLW